MIASVCVFACLSVCLTAYALCCTDFTQKFYTYSTYTREVHCSQFLKSEMLSGCSRRFCESVLYPICYFFVKNSFLKKPNIFRNQFIISLSFDFPNLKFGNLCSIFFLILSNCSYLFFYFFLSTLLIIQ